MIEQLTLYILSFSIFVILQSFAINGIYESFRGGKIDDINNGISYKGNILFMLAPKFFEKNKDKYWSKPFFSCVKCMSSVYGAITFWPLVIFVFGFNIIEILVFIFDIFILVTLNWIIYKKL